MLHHYTGTEYRPTVLETASYQIGPTSHLAAPAICYHLYIEADGTIYLCHDLEVVTWNAGSGSPGAKLGIGLNNWWGVAICFAGLVPTPAQLMAMALAGDWIDWKLGRKLQRRAHRQVSVDATGRRLTQCCGDVAEAWVMAS